MQNTLFSFDSPVFSEWYFFKNSTELGRIYNLIPWDDLAKLLPEKKNPAGAPSYLPRAGYFGLMFLKHYTGLSDEKLLAAFQTNYAYQMFCGCRLKVGEMIRDNAFVSRIRCYLAKYCDMNKVQNLLVEAWKGNLDNTNVLMMDATCYEVHLRFPTDVKILWESCSFLWAEQIPGICKLSGLKIPRSKFREHKIKQVDFSKKRKISIKNNKRRVKSLLRLLKKGIETYQYLLNQVKGLHLSEYVAKRFKTIRKVYEQQRYLIENKTTSVKDRIVSLSQPHIRPIVRGKENKPVEFGIKAHIMQVGGLNIVEYHSFEAFNETTRLKNAYFKHRTLIGSCTHIAADGIYPTNSNRRFCTAKKLQTNFVSKGKKVKDKNTKKVKSILSIERGTRMEGSFGTEKENYGLRKIKAKTSATQIVWMFFGILTANVVRLSKRQKIRPVKAA